MTSYSANGPQHFEVYWAITANKLSYSTFPWLILKMTIIPRCFQCTLAVSKIYYKANFPLWRVFISHYVEPPFVKYSCHRKCLICNFESKITLQYWITLCDVIMHKVYCHSSKSVLLTQIFDSFCITECEGNVFWQECVERNGNRSICWIYGDCDG